MIESLEDRLRADMTDPDKRNSLLAANINAVVTEECRTNSRLGEVGRLTGGRYLCRPVFLPSISAPTRCISCALTRSCRWWRRTGAAPPPGTGRGRG